jgi:hypothetical protein
MVADLGPSPNVAAVRDTFRQLEAWLGAHCPRAYEDLQAGARRSQLAVVESELGHFLPDDVVALFREHDGQSGDGPAVFPPFELLDLESAMREWRTLRRALGTVPLFFPIASDGKGRLCGVRLVAESAGTRVYEIQNAGAEREVSSSVAAWLALNLQAREAARVERHALAARGVTPPFSDCHSSSFPPG